MPKMGNIGVANAGAFGYTIASLGSIYYIAYFGATSKNLVNYSIAVDSGGNVYSGGRNSTDSRPYLVKINRSGPSLGLQGTVASSTITYSVIVDGSNIWPVFGLAAQKLDLSGNLVFGGNLNNFTTIYKTILSGNTFYAIGGASSSGTCALLSMNVASNFTTANFCYLYSIATLTDSFYGGALDSSGNIIACGSKTASMGGLTKITPGTATPVWTRANGRSGTTATRYLAVCVDSSDNSYAVGYSYTSTLFGMCICKTNSAGDRQFFRIIVAANGDQFNDCALSVNGQYLYCVGQRGGNCSIVAINTSDGSLYFQRSIAAGTSCIGKSIAVTANAMYIGATLTITGGNSVNLVCSLPLDGSKTAVYTVGGQSIDYGTANATYSSPAMATQNTTNWTTAGTTSASVTSNTTAMTNPGYSVFSGSSIT